MGDLTLSLEDGSGKCPCSVNHGNHLQGDGRPVAPRPRRDSSISLYFTNLPTIPELEPLVTPPSPTDGKHMDQSVAPTCGEKCNNNYSCCKVADLYLGHPYLPTRPVISKTDHHPHSVLSTWTYAQFSILKNGSHPGNFDSPFSTYSDHKHGMTSPIAILNAKQHHDGTDSSKSDIGDHSSVLTLEEDQPKKMTRAQKIQMRIMMAVGFVLVIGILLWIISPFFPF
ncbi:unnamed protein product [Lymnaea stagnalis]|uniref:Uncharacterized protein n=1 Tax=Lymnaea stagnalis TaxID=6523 RepID=A0AAV2H6A6_LYMST